MAVSTEVNKQIAQAVRRPLFPPVLRDPPDPDPDVETPEEDIAFLRQAKVIPTAQQREVRKDRRRGRPRIEERGIPILASQNITAASGTTTFAAIATLQQPAVLTEIQISATVMVTGAVTIGDLSIELRLGPTGREAGDSYTQADFDALLPLFLAPDNQDPARLAWRFNATATIQHTMLPDLSIPHDRYTLGVRVQMTGANMVAVPTITAVFDPIITDQPIISRVLVIPGRRAGNLSTRGARPRGPRRRVPRFVTIEPISQRESLGSRRVAWPFLAAPLKRKIVQAQIEGRSLPGIFVEY